MDISIENILAYKYPVDLYNGNIVLQDDGQGTYIKTWNLPTPKPTKAQMLAYTQEQGFIDAANLSDKAKRNAVIIDKLERIDIMSIRAIRTGDVAKMAEWEAKAQALRDLMV